MKKIAFTFRTIVLNIFQYFLSRKQNNGDLPVFVFPVNEGLKNLIRPYGRKPLFSWELSKIAQLPSVPGAIWKGMSACISRIKLKLVYKEIWISPIPAVGPIPTDSGYNSSYAKIVSSAKIDSGALELKTTVPPNSTTKITVPTQNPKQVTGDGKQLVENSNLPLFNNNTLVILTALPSTSGITIPYKQILL